MEYLDTLVDQALASLVLAVEHQVGGDREDPRFLAAFPSAPSAASAGIATDTQRDYVTSALAVLGEDKTLTGLGPLLDALKAHQNALENALRIREAFFGVEATASARLKVATLQARNAHNEALPKLQVIYPRQKALVKSFFYR